MKSLKYLLALLAIHTLVTSQKPTAPPPNFRIQGKVLTADGNKELPNVHVYIIHGEEEALTNSRGQFSIESWQKLPLRVYAAAQGFQPASVVVKDARQAVTIYLQQR